MMDDQILPGAFKSAHNIPVLFNFDHSRVIGRCSFNADTNIITMQISDPEVVAFLKADLRSTSIAPAVRLGVEVKTNLEKENTDEDPTHPFT